MDGLGTEDLPGGGDRDPGPRWRLGLLSLGLLVTCWIAWLVLTDAPVVQFLVRLYVDKRFLKHTLRDWGLLAPVVFVLLQALQVIVAPIPGDLTGLLGGYLFGEWLGVLYSTIGLTLGSLTAFAVGRWIGAQVAQRLVSREVWEKMGFIVEPQGAILCFAIYLIPGVPKDMLCYLFGMSPMPLWIFAVASTLGRLPSTWILSSQGAKTAAGNYLEVLLLTAVVVALVLPLYYQRHRVITYLRRGREA